MGSMVKLQYTRLEMLTLNSSSSVDDKIADHSQFHVADANKNLSEELPVDNVACEKDMIDVCRSCPTRRRTRRVVLGFLKSDPEDGVCYFTRTKMIVDEKNLRARGVDKYLCSSQMIVDEKNLWTNEGKDNLCGTQMIVHEKNSSKSRKRSGDEDYVVSAADFREEESSRKRSDDEDYVVSAADFREEESCTKKRPKNSRRKQILVQNYPTSKLPQNLQDYIGRLNLEAPPLFVAQKTLYPSDIRIGQNRLSLPERTINTDFFAKCVTDIEKKILNGKQHVEVSVVDNKMHEYHNMCLVKWEMNSSSIYVLRTAWNNVVKDNEWKEVVLAGQKDTIVVMKEDDKFKSDVVVQVWCFRTEARLWFALDIQAKTERNVIGMTKEGLYIVT